MIGVFAMAGACDSGESLLQWEPSLSLLQECPQEF
jgi:hypothetical protein